MDGKEKEGIIDYSSKRSPLRLLKVLSQCILSLLMTIHPPYPYMFRPPRGVYIVSTRHVPPPYPSLGRRGFSRGDSKESNEVEGGRVSHGGKVDDIVRSNGVGFLESKE